MKKSIIHCCRMSLEMALLTIMLTLSGSCSKNSTVPGINEVFIQGMAFSPSNITVTSGTTITWTNKDAVAHTVTSTSGLFDSGSINTNGTYSHMFSTVGTFPYICTIHPLMTASVIVN
jgi:plastocyanin